MDDDKTEKYTAGDLLLGVLALMAPSSATAVAVRLISQMASKTAGKEAETILEHFREYSNASEFLKDVAGSLEPDLVGPKDEPDKFQQEILRIATTLLQSELMEVLMGDGGGLHDPADPSSDGPTPGCTCPRCELLRGTDTYSVELKFEHAPPRSKKDVN